MPTVPADPRGEDPDLALVASELQALSDAHEVCTRNLDELEAITDALLDDPHWCVLVLEHDLRIRAASRGMADDLGLGPAVVGKSFTDVVPDAWHALAGALPEAVVDRWVEVPLGTDTAGVLTVRRAAIGDEAPPIFVVRFQSTR